MLHRIRHLPVVAGREVVGSSNDRDRRSDGAASVRLDHGDQRPGRPAARPVAVVIDANPARRLRMRNDVAAAGYDAVTCPGPAAGVRCPAAMASTDRCPRVWRGVSLVVMDPETVDTGAAASYARWLPAATIRISARTPAAVRP